MEFEELLQIEIVYMHVEDFEVHMCVVPDYLLSKIKLVYVIKQS